MRFLVSFVACNAVGQAAAMMTCAADCVVLGLYVFTCVLYGAYT